ncbi:MAG: nicotinate phosphoribosyltransferase [Chloroflexi bacterium]|nr:nicotinate phosphoribosyltransferase [Chloroflexota bacterium]
MNPEQQKLAEGILFTDMYQLTMAQLYFRTGLQERPAQFDHFFRTYPNYGSHQAGYCINAGLEWLLDWMKRARFHEEELECLRGEKSRTGGRLFGDDFIAWLRKNGSFEGISLQAIPEGRVVHPNVPLTVVRGPMAMAQILETPLLNALNYPILVATKAARVRAAATSTGRGALLLEFGLRRAQERAGNAGARAALIGGADFSSNTGLSYALGFSPKGTHAHSMVQAFMALGASELDAFQAYADVYPDDCLLLVDTVNTLESGVPNAIRVFERLRCKGHKPVGIRLDSGDLAHLAVEAAKMLDAAGFPDTVIVLSNQLDELVILQVLQQIHREAALQGLDAEHIINRLVYGVGTRLITSAGDAALDGVYKLVAVQKDGEWVPAIKMSETPAKTPNPGHKKVWRLYDKRGYATADLLGLYDEEPLEAEEIMLRHPIEATEWRVLARDEITAVEELLVDVLDEGKLVYDLPSIEEMRAVRDRDLERLDEGVKRLINPHIYHVSLTQTLWDLKQELIAKYRRDFV